MATKLEGGGALVVGPLVDERFSAASLTCRNNDIVLVGTVEGVDYRRRGRPTVLNNISLNIKSWKHDFCKAFVFIDTNLQRIKIAKLFCNYLYLGMPQKQ